MSEWRARTTGWAVARGLALSLLAAACGGGSDGGGVTPPPPPPPPITPVATVSPATATIILGRSGQLTASARDNTGAVVPDDRIAWSSSDENVARVSATGLVTVVGAGAPATITASGGGAQATATITPAGPAYRQVSAGAAHVCALTLAGAAYCWGQNFVGQLGGGSAGSDSAVPVAVHGGLSFASIEAGGAFTCGLTADGSAYCWGNPSFGQLGNATTQGMGPVAVDGGLHFTTITGGANHACALVASGAAYCWGRNDQGQLGDGPTPVARIGPVAVSGGLTFASISAGTTDHTCAITADGAAYCWGSNTYGELGDGTTTASRVPVRVAGGLTFGAIAVAGPTSCALTTAGAAYCWGNGDNGTIGDGTFDSHLVPTAAATGTRFASIVAGGASNCALTAAGAAWCWGQVGGAVVTTPEPLARSSIAFASLSIGGVTCGRTALGVVYCWGSGFGGMLGDGTTDDRDTPLSITTP